MKNFRLLIAAVLFSGFAFAQTNVEWEKDNFPGKKDEFKEAKRWYTEGKKIFDEGKAQYDDWIKYMVNEGMMPCSRSELKNTGNDFFKESLPLLMKANEFNPNNALLNYMIAFSYFCLDPQHDNYVKYFEQAYKLNPNVTLDEKYYMAWGYHLNLRWDEAIKEYKEVLADLSKDQKKHAVWIKDINKKIKECNHGKEYTAAPKRVFIDNVGAEINTSYPDFGAVITADESMMIFTSRRNTSTGGITEPGSNEYFEDLYVSYRKDGKWTQAMNMGEPLNTNDHDATAGLSHDGQLLYIYRFEDRDGGDIWESQIKGAKWSKPDRMNKYINSDKHESTVSLSYDDKQLYFISDKKGGLGDRDVYVSKLDPKGKWLESVNVGAPINTEYPEEGIFMHPDGKTMYFSSKGHSSMGGFDIFRSEFKDGKWGEPVNLGYPINGPHDDVFFVINASGRRGYYASAKQGGYGEKDIYVITFLGDEKPFAMSNEDNLIASIAEPVKTIVVAPAAEIKNSLTILRGTITDAGTKKPVEATIELVDNTKNEVIATFKSNSSTGKYLVSLPAGKNYGISVKAENYLFHSENFDIPQNNGYLEVTKDVELKNVAVGTKIVLRNIFFDFDKATLKPESTNELERLIKLLNDLPTMKIELGGHTDSKGSDEYNLTLSGKRAAAVVDYLVSHGISKDRLKSAGYGEKVPIATNDTDEGRALNRRTEFEIISK